MGTISKRFLNTASIEPRLGAMSPELPAPTSADIDCYIGRLEIAFATPAAETAGGPDGRRDPYQFD